MSAAPPPATTVAAPAPASPGQADPLVGQVWDSPEGRRIVEGRATVAGALRYVVRTGDRPTVELMDEATLARARARDEGNARTRGEKQRRDEAARSAADAAKRAREDIDGFGDSFPAITRTKAVQALMRTVSADGRLMSRRDLVREKVAAGGRVVTRPDGERVLQMPDGAYLERAGLGKTGLDYAEHLASLRPGAPNQSRAMGAVDHLRATNAQPGDGSELAELKARFARAKPGDRLYDTYRTWIEADPSKWRTGMGVTYQVAGGRGMQTNRGYRVVQVDPANKRIAVQLIRDAGYADAMPGDPPRWIWMGEARRAKADDAAELGQALHNFTLSTGHSFRAALYRSAASVVGTHGAGDTNYSNMGADELPGGSGYTAGGATLTNVTPVLDAAPETVRLELARRLAGKARRQPAIVRRKLVTESEHAVVQGRKSEAAPNQVAMLTSEAPDWLFDAVAGAPMHPRHDELDRKLKAARRSKAAAKSP
jgi:hypothetical protein